MNVKCGQAEQICQQLGGSLAKITGDNMDQMLNKFKDVDTFKTVCKETMWASTVAGNCSQKGMICACAHGPESLYS